MHAVPCVVPARSHGQCAVTTEGPRGLDASHLSRRLLVNTRCNELPRRAPVRKAPRQYSRFNLGSGGWSNWLPANVMWPLLHRRLPMKPSPMTRWIRTLALSALAVLVLGLAPADARPYRRHNPPGPRGGPGTSWANPPGPRGGPGASPHRLRHYRDRSHHPHWRAGGVGRLSRRWLRP